MSAEQAAKALAADVEGATVVEFRDELTLIVTRDSAKDVLKKCRDEHSFNFLLDVSSLDHFGDDPRFEMVYELYSMERHDHLRVRFALGEDEKPDTVSDLWPTANWHERECYDMMGIEFEGHPDMTRILMWEGFPYFPLRKDFPLAGRESEMPDVAFTNAAPLAGGPFVTSPTDASTLHREPRSREMD
jgi:NADH-quinone oxidoreductase subunit C